MPKRIPHTDLEVITGVQKTQDYLEMQKKLGKFYFKDFFAKFDILIASLGKSVYRDKKSL